MYLFFLIFFIFISISLIFFILLQPGKVLNNTVHTKNNIKFFNGIGTNSFITNIIRILSFLFLLTSIILCNINNRKTDSNFFWEDNHKKTITKNFSNKKTLNSDIPN